MTSTLLALSLISPTQAKSMIMMDPDQVGAMSSAQMNRLKTGPKVSESNPNHIPGIFLIREETFENAIYEYALKDLYGTKIDAIARLKTNGSLEFWNINGRPLKAEEVDIPPPIAKEIKPDTIAFRIHQPVKVDGVENPDHDFDTSGLMAYRWTKFIDRWIIVPNLGKPTVDVFLSIKASYPVAELMPNVGSEVSFDGIRFAVVDDKKRANEVRDSRLLSQAGLRESRIYEYQVRLNTSKFLAGNPSAPDTSCHCWNEDVKSTSLDSRQTYVSSDKAAIFWGGIMIKRKLELHAYIANIPTKPRGEK